jgi:hypothetical protein
MFSPTLSFALLALLVPWPAYLIVKRGHRFKKAIETAQKKTIIHPMIRVFLISFSIDIGSSFQLKGR